MRKRPTITLIAGPAGCGKTFVGNLISRQTGMFIDKDKCTRAFAEALLTSLGADKDDRESETYMTKVRPLEYQTIMRIATENVAVHWPVIVASPFLQEFPDRSWRESVTARMSGYGAEVFFVWVNSEPSLIRDRLIRRGASRDKWKLANWSQYLSMTPHTLRDPGPGVIIIENTLAPDVPFHEQLEILTERVAGGGRVADR